MKYIFAALVAICMVCSVGCSKQTTHDVNRINKQFSDDLDQFEKDATTLHAQAAIGDADYQAIEGYIAEVASDHKTLTDNLRKMLADGTGKDQAIAAVQNFINSVNAKQLHLTSAAAQQKYQLFVTAFQASVQLLNDTLATMKPSPLKAGFDAESAIAIVLMVWGNLNALVLKWKADGTLTDQQLQDAADAEDDETKKRALLALAGKPSGS